MTNEAIMGQMYQKIIPVMFINDQITCTFKQIKKHYITSYTDFFISKKLLKFIFTITVCSSENHEQTDNMAPINMSNVTTEESNETFRSLTRDTISVMLVCPEQKLVLNPVQPR